MTQSEYENQMSPNLLKRWKLFKEKLNARGLDPKLSNVIRSAKVQIALVLQGRSIAQSIKFLEEEYPIAKEGVKPVIRDILRRLKETKLSPFVFCNEYRKELGIIAVHPGDWYEVTWTVNTRHYANKEGKGEAFDFFFNIPGHEWDIKLDQNKTGGPDFDEAGKAAEEVGLRWGGRFGDRPHCELFPRERV